MTFYIELDNPVRSYFPGQPVSGRVIVEAESESKTTGIYINFVGNASVDWTEQSHARLERYLRNEAFVMRYERFGGRSYRRTVHYSAKEEFFDHRIYLIENGGNEVIIPPGRQSYPFQFTLPPGLSSTFEGAHGKIAYFATAIMERSWRFNLKDTVSFSVNAILDLNTNPRSQLPLELRGHKYLCCLCCQSGPISFVLKLPKGGYVPGENIRILVEMSNQSRRKVVKTKLTLFQEISYHSSQGKSKTQTQIISSARGPDVDGGESELWTGNVLQVPPIIPPSQLGSCRIIDVHYYLKMEMDISGVSLSLKGKVPIIIGTVGNIQPPI